MIELDVILRGDLKSIPHKTVKRNFRYFKQIFCSSLEDCFSFLSMSKETDYAKILISPWESLNFTQFTERTAIPFKLETGNWVVYVVEAKS